MLLHILQEGQRAIQLPSIDCLCSFTGILERDTEVGTTRTGGLAVVDGFSVSCVPDHLCVD